MENDTTLRETERFVRYFNKFFDLMNVRSTTEHIHARNPNKKPYYSIDDERLKVKHVHYTYCTIMHMCDHDSVVCYHDNHF